MPCIELSLPKVEPKIRAALAASLTEAFCTATGHPAEIFGIRFFEYEPGEASVAGRICGDNGGPAYLHMLVYTPRLKRSTKQKLGVALMEAFRVATGRKDWAPSIHLSEHPYDNVVVDGKLLSDAFEECAKRPFYYELPKD